MTKRGRRKGPTIASDERSFDPDDREIRAAIRERLRKFINSTYDSLAAFERASGVSHSAASDWMNSEGALPDSDSLLKIAAQGLSLDWLVLGHEPMKVAVGFTEGGELLEHLRPHLQRLTNEGDHTATMAFHYMRLRIGPQMMLEKAAEGLRAEFSRQTDELKRVQQLASLQSLVWPMLWDIEDAANKADASAVEALLQRLRTEVEGYLPVWYRAHPAERAAVLRAFAEEETRLSRANETRSPQADAINESTDFARVLRAIGALTVNFNAADHTLRRIAWRLIDPVSDRTGQVVTDVLGVAKIEDLVVALLNLRIADLTLREQLDRAIRESRAVRDLRNRYVHAFWRAPNDSTDIERAEAARAPTRKNSEYVVLGTVGSVNDLAAASRRACELSELLEAVLAKCTDTLRIHG